MAKNKTKKLRMSYAEFAAEIKTDLWVLQREFPEGVYVHNLKGYYGEPLSRIHYALSELVNQGVVELRQAHDNTYYIVEVGVEPPILVELTPMQRRIARYVIDVCKRGGTHQLRTDYSQLQRLLKVSPLGLKSAMQKLNALGYLLITEKSMIGFAGMMLLTIGPNLKKAYDAHHLDS